MAQSDFDPRRPGVPELISVVDVRVLSRYFLELTFDTGEVRVIDFEPMLWGPAFEPLVADYRSFCAVGVDAGTIRWPNGADWSPDELYVKSKPATPGASDR